MTCRIGVCTSNLAYWCAGVQHCLATDCRVAEVWAVALPKLDQP